MSHLIKTFILFILCLLSSLAIAQDYPELEDEFDAFLDDGLDEQLEQEYNSYNNEIIQEPGQQPQAPQSSAPTTSFDGLYTVQLGAFKTKNRAQQFLNGLNLPDPQDSGIVEIFSSNAYWFILSYSVYDTVSDARKAARQLCARNNLSGCWARSLNQIIELNQIAKQSR